ncbi:MAG: hypothetical protein AAGA12_06845 [Pseudomonadota bacterium]
MAFALSLISAVFLYILYAKFRHRKANTKQAVLLEAKQTKRWLGQLSAYAVGIIFVCVVVLIIFLGIAITQTLYFLFSEFWSQL